ncbi:MAG: hypothetical protein KKB20_01900 [Proteobacteria bacterium]|nr:hypothetical protein [Pseudomonadota bacterium]
MDNVVDLKDYGLARAVQRVQSPWRERFPDFLTARTRLADLSDKTLLILARLEDGAMTWLLDLIMTALDLGPEGGFSDLDAGPKMRVLDAQLFFVDQVRWECLRRLGWVTGFAAESYPLVDLILRAAEIKAGFEPPFPALKETHADYAEFEWRRKIDGEQMIRSMIPAALAALGQRI